ncbi:hypothetical protein Pmani_008074 [Petrolisthes manimaculis]|uniref:Small ribosomal subunit protein uS10 domain-containing protein n=1 Tax=Petrolisthes manimaculis TaxID=1843537 RepID=A0AAE1Q692_9EUCA|nr:hypothetical protein Pmani_008074 [Petrolisthes manimaculis]
MTLFTFGVLRRCVGAVKHCSLSTTALRSRVQFEPPYLDASGPEIPEYPQLNVQVKGYDFTVVEHYAKWVHNTALNMGIDVEDSWATPCEKYRIQTFKPKSTNVEADYHLQEYDRTVQLADLPSVVAPLFLEVIQAGLPTGVEISVHPHQPEHSQIRYIPDLELKTLQLQLHELGGPSKK